MPIKNFDDMAREMFEPIQVVIDGKEYAVKKVSANMIDGITKMDEGGGEVKVVCKQLAMVLGAKPDTFNDTDMRVVVAALQFITEEATKQMGENVPKNPVQDEVKQ
jgi:hypothetical protein